MQGVYGWVFMAEGSRSLEFGLQHKAIFKFIQLCQMFVQCLKWCMGMINTWKGCWKPGLSAGDPVPRYHKHPESSAVSYCWITGGRSCSIPLRPFSGAEGVLRQISLAQTLRKDTRPPAEKVVSWVSLGCTLGPLGWRTCSCQFLSFWDGPTQSRGITTTDQDPRAQSLNFTLQYLHRKYFGIQPTLHVMGWLSLLKCVWGL